MAELVLAITNSTKIFPCNMELLMTHSTYFANLLNQIKNLSCLNATPVFVLDNITEQNMTHLIAFLSNGQIILPESEAESFAEIGKRYAINVPEMQLTYNECKKINEVVFFLEPRKQCAVDGNSDETDGSVHEKHYGNYEFEKMKKEGQQEKFFEALGMILTTKKNSLPVVPPNSAIGKTKNLRSKRKRAAVKVKEEPKEDTLVDSESSCETVKDSLQGSANLPAVNKQKSTKKSKSTSQLNEHTPNAKGANKRNSTGSRKYKNYTPETLNLALDLIRNGNSPLDIAKKYEIPSRTIYDKMKKLGIQYKLKKQTNEAPIKKRSRTSKNMRYNAQFPTDIGHNTNGVIYNEKLYTNNEYPTKCSVKGNINNTKNETITNATMDPARDAAMRETVMNIAMEVVTDSINTMSDPVNDTMENTLNEMPIKKENEKANEVRGDAINELISEI